MRLNIKKYSTEYIGIFLASIFSGFLISFYDLSVLFIIALILFVIASFKYFNAVLYFLILYIPFQIALNITSGIDLASGRVLILYLFAVWIIKSLAEKRFVIKLNLQTLLILLFLFIACFSILNAWDIERAFRKILVFLSIFPLYFMITSLESSDERLQRGIGKILQESLKNSVFVIPAKAGIQDLTQKTSFKNVILSVFQSLLNMLLISGFIISIIGIIQFALQFITGIDPIIKFWSEIIAPIFYGNAFGAEVISNPSWLVNIGGATVLRAISLFPDPHMFSFYLGLLIPIALAIVLFNKGYINNRPSENSKNLQNCHSRAGGNPEDKRLFLQTGFPIEASGMTVIRKSGNRIIIQSNKFLFLILFTMFLAELLTFSRGGYLGMIAGIGAVLFFSWRYIAFNKKIIIGFFAGIFVLFMLFGNQSIVNRFLSSFNPSEGSNTERMKNWSQGWEVFSDNSLTGVGIGNYSFYLYPTADYRTPIYAHNLYLDIGAEMGIFALFIWILLIAITIYQLFKLSRSASDNFTRSTSLGIIGSLVWFSVHGFFDTPIYSPTILAVFIIILGLAAMIMEDKAQKM